ncbi:hydroxymethylglutaryl-CoA reductase (NADPH) [Sulfolobales archaeon HS-7]|nr:hydroxymethylglutaryl-CoA reductase (NADPH) [Sulfolobales archaeon HS-7]
MELDELLKKLEKKEIDFNKLESYLNPNEAALLRRLFIEKNSGKSLSSIGSTIIDFKDVYGKNIENPIGATQIPLGVAGPININGNYAKGSFYVPLATTEGALVASVNRGIKAVNASGGVNVIIIHDSMTRAPVFSLPSISYCKLFINWINENFSKIKEVAESTTKYGKLKSIDTFVTGNNVWLRFSFSTGDAMGMNMVTLAVEKACEYIEKGFPEAKCIAVSGNMCSDKKLSYVNTLLGRGKTVIAEAILPGKIVKEFLKSRAEEIVETNLRKNWLGSARAGSPQFNAHFANIITAIFIATGQDVAQVIESSSGYTWAEVREDNLYFSVTLPSLEVGTVGGGTQLPTQSEALNLLEVKGSGNPPGSNSLKFAEIIAATVLAGELNLLAAITSRELGKAHMKYGRKMNV